MVVVVAAIALLTRMGRLHATIGIVLGAGDSFPMTVATCSGRTSCRLVYVRSTS